MTKAAAVLYFCWAFTGPVAPPSPSATVPPTCTLGAWLPASTIVMPGTYTGEDTDRNPQLLRQGRRVKR